MLVDRIPEPGPVACIWKTNVPPAAYERYFHHVVAEVLISRTGEHGFVS